MDSRVEAIRSSKIVGRGSCSSIDECMSDAELVQELDDDKVTDPTKAVEWAIDREDLHLENGLNTRWGEDTDPQLATYLEFKASVATNK